jgi:hypothetical protein
MGTIDFSKIKYDTGAASGREELAIDADLCVFGATSAGIAAAV